MQYVLFGCSDATEITTQCIFGKFFYVLALDSSALHFKYNNAFEGKMLA